MVTVLQRELVVDVPLPRAWDQMNASAANV